MKDLDEINIYKHEINKKKTPLTALDVKKST